MPDSGNNAFWTGPSTIAVVAVVCFSILGAVTSTPLFAPFFVVSIVVTGALLLSTATISPIERLILVPAVGIVVYALASLVLPLTSTLGIAEEPIHTPLVLAFVVALPPIFSFGYATQWGRFSVPEVDVEKRQLLLLLPALAGAGGALLQYQFDVVAQNYLIMVFLAVAGPAVLYWAKTELEVVLGLYSIALGVLFSHTLVTAFSVGIDVQMSLHAIDQITANGTWPVNNVDVDPSIGDAPISEGLEYVNSGLSHTGLPIVVGLPILLESVGNVSPDAAFDVVNVLLFSLLPVGVYRLARERLPVREAFVAGMILIVYYRFFHTSPAKQHLAQFFVAALLVGWHAKPGRPHRKALTALMTVGIVFSHYAVTFLFLGFLTGGWVCTKWFARSDFKSPLSFPFVGFFYSITLGWFVFVTGAEKPVTAMSAVAKSIEALMSNSPQSRTGASVVAEQTLLVDQINLGLHAMLLGAIGVGVLSVVYHAIRTREPTFSRELDSLSVGFFALVAASLVVSGHLGIDRTLDIGLVVLAPIAVFGVKQSLTVASRFLGNVELAAHTYRIGLCFVVVMILFSSGIAYEVAGNPASSAINLHEDHNSVAFDRAEFEAANWVLEERGNSTVYVGAYTSVTFTRLSGRSPPYLTDYKDYKLDIVIDWNSTGYVFVRKSALTNRTYEQTPEHKLQYDRYRSFSDRSDLVYENDAIVVFRIDPNTELEEQQSQETAVRPSTR